MRFLMVALGIMSSAFFAEAADLYQLQIHQNQTGMDQCEILFPRKEPSAVLTYKMNNQLVSRPAYSDLCVISAQWISVIFINQQGNIVGIGLGNTFETDGQLSISEKWRQSRE